MPGPKENSTGIFEYFSGHSANEKDLPVAPNGGLPIRAFTVVRSNVIELHLRPTASQPAEAATDETPPAEAPTG